MNETGEVIPAPTAPEPLRSKLWANRRTIAAVLGLFLGLVCPLLPVQLRAPCAVVAAASRTWTIGGNELP